MEHAVEELASELQNLNDRVQNLERRIAELEGHPATLSPPATFPTIVVREIESSKPPETWKGFPPAQVPSGAIAAFGKAVLGIAGAYLLRAISEGGVVSQLPILIVAVLYAAGWMYWAGRTHNISPFAGNLYGITSALILAPLLWESTTRFQVIPPAFSALVLPAFLALTLFVAWRRNLQALPWVAVLATVTTTWALIIETHDVVPLTGACLAMLLVVEVAACFGSRFTIRAVPMIAADFAVALTIDLMTASEGIPPGYHPAARGTLILMSLALFVISSGSIAVRSFGRRQQMTVLEIAQTVPAFALATVGVLRSTQNAAAPVFGMFFLILAMACYWGALSRFTAADSVRNRRVAATWAAALLIAGSYLAMPASILVPILSIAAVAAALLFTCTGKLSLGLHVSVYLAAATVFSGLPLYAANALIGDIPKRPAASVWMVAVCGLLCYVVGSRKPESQPKRRLLWIVPALVITFSATALVVAALALLGTNRLEWSAARLSVLRTVVTCACALALGYLGAHSRRLELGWVAYSVVGFGALKLVFEDLRFGNAGSLVISLVSYGFVLVLLPRLRY